MIIPLKTLLRNQFLLLLLSVFSCVFLGFELVAGIVATSFASMLSPWTHAEPAELMTASAGHMHAAQIFLDTIFAAGADLGV